MGDQENIIVLKPKITYAKQEEEPSAIIPIPVSQGITSKFCVSCEIDGIPIADFRAINEVGKQVEYDNCVRCRKLIARIEAKKFIRKHIAGFTKKCIGCKLELPGTVFNKDKSRKDGLNTRCRECQKSYMEGYLARNPGVQKLAQKRAVINRKVKDGKLSPSEAAVMLSELQPKQT